MSLSNFGPRSRSLIQFPWIVNCICSPTRKRGGHTVDVIRHLETRPDGSIVREVADKDVFIRAVFSPQAIETFKKDLNVEESDSFPLNWNQALLLIVEYHTEFRPHRNLDQCEFVLHITLFRLWHVMEGFERKTRLIHCSLDPRVKKKTKELWEEKQLEWQRQEEQKNSKVTASQFSHHNESAGSDSLTQLLEEMAKAGSQNDTSHEEIQEMDSQGTQKTRTRKRTRSYTRKKLAEQDKELAKEDQQTNRNRQETPEENLITTTQKQISDDGETACVQDLRRPFLIDELLIPEHERLILEEIPEWKEGYMPPRTGMTNSDEVDSSSKIDSYVRHTLIDDVSSMETSGQASSPKKGKRDSTPKKMTDKQHPSSGVEEGHREQEVLIPSPLPRQCHSTQQDATEAQMVHLGESDTRHNIDKTMSANLGLNVTGPENTSSEIQSSDENLNKTGPFVVCDVLESQGFVPCMSPEAVSTTDTNQERFTTSDNVVTLVKHDKSLKALEQEEEKRLQKLAMPSQDCSGCDVMNLAREIKQTTCSNEQEKHNRDSDRNQTIGQERGTIKHKTRVKKVPREETPYSSSQTDSEPDNQLKQRRLTYSNAKSRNNSSSPVTESFTNKNNACQQSPVNRNQSEGEVQPSPELRTMEKTVSGITKYSCRGTPKNNVTRKRQSVEESVEKTIIINSSHESSSSGDSPSVLKSLKELRKVDQSDLANLSLPSYQLPRNSQSQTMSHHSQSNQTQNLCFPKLDTPITDKAMLLASLTNLQAPTELGQKLLKLKFPDRLVNKMVDYYIRE